MVNGPLCRYSAVLRLSLSDEPPPQGGLLLGFGDAASGGEMTRPLVVGEVPHRAIYLAREAPPPRWIWTPPPTGLAFRSPPSERYRRRGATIAAGSPDKGLAEKLINDDYPSEHKSWAAADALYRLLEEP